MMRRLIIVIAECTLFINVVSTSEQKQLDCSGYSFDVNINQTETYELLELEYSWVANFYNIFKLRGKGKQLKVNEKSKELIACAMSKLPKEDSIGFDITKSPLEETQVSFKLFDGHEDSWYTFPTIKFAGENFNKYLYFIKGNIARGFLKNWYNVYVLFVQYFYFPGSGTRSVKVIAKNVPFD